jgi:hypothetical protein
LHLILHFIMINAYGPRTDTVMVNFYVSTWLSHGWPATLLIIITGCIWEGGSWWDQHLNW